MNKCIFMGRLGSDVEIRSTQSGKSVGKLSIAVDYGYGEHKKTVWVNLVAFGKTAENISRFFRKGNRILVETRMNVRSWDSDGGKKWMTEFIVDNFYFVEKSGRSSSSGDNDDNGWADDSNSSSSANSEHLTVDDCPF